jgi:hypothetical protein
LRVRGPTHRDAHGVEARGFDAGEICILQFPPPSPFRRSFERIPKVQATSELGVLRETIGSWFRREQAGKTIIRVCRTLACALAGSYEVKEKFCQAVGLNPDCEHHGFGHAPPTTADGNFSVEFVECLASCGSAPVALINDDLVENIAPADVPSIVASYK